MKFSTIIADPPWDYGEVACHRSNKGTGAAVAHYPTMTVDEITSLPVRDFAEKDAHLYLWITNSFMLAHGENIVKAWGFEPKSIITWVKTYDAENQPEWYALDDEAEADFAITEPRVRVGLGRWFLNATEHMIFATRGKKPLLAKVPNVIFAPVQGHSVKPPESYALIEKASGCDGILEMFARRRRPNYHVWGNELPNDVEMG